MLIINAYQTDLEEALRRLNEEFDNNVMWNRFDRTDYVGGQPAWKITLRVRNSRGPGARLSQQYHSNGRRYHMAAACWHVYGRFLDILGELAPDCRADLVDADRKKRRQLVKDHGWVDLNIGSMMYPLWYSDACDCNEAGWFSGGKWNADEEVWE